MDYGEMMSNMGRAVDLEIRENCECGNVNFMTKTRETYVCAGCGKEYYYEKALRAIAQIPEDDKDKWIKYIPLITQDEMNAWFQGGGEPATYEEAIAVAKQDGVYVAHASHENMLPDNSAVDEFMIRVTKCYKCGGSDQKVGMLTPATIDGKNRMLCGVCLLVHRKEVEKIKELKENIPSYDELYSAFESIEQELKRLHAALDRQDWPVEGDTPNYLTKCRRKLELMVGEQRRVCERPSVSSGAKNHRYLKNLQHQFDMLDTLFEDGALKKSVEEDKWGPGSVKSEAEFQEDLARSRGEYASDEDEKLCDACERGDFDEAWDAIEDGATVDCRDNEPIRLAGENGHLDIVEHLITLGAKRIKEVDNEN